MTSEFEEFPDLGETGVRPDGWKVLLQMKRVADMTAGGIVLPDQVKDADKFNTSVARVIAMGEGAFRDRITGQRYVGRKIGVGSMVVIGRHAGLKLDYPWKGGMVELRFVNDDELPGDMNDEAVKKISGLR